MAKKTENAICVVCGNKYHLCVACNRDKSNWKSWNIIADKEECYNIYNIVSKYVAKDITKSEAKELLNAFDLSNLENFKDVMKAKIKEILELRDNKIVETIVEEIVSEETTEDKVEKVYDVKVVDERTTKKNFKKKEN
jgi:hypothetical protein